MVAGISYNPAEAKSLPHEGGIGSCAMLLEALLLAVMWQFAIQQSVACLHGLSPLTMKHYLVLILWVTPEVLMNRYTGNKKIINYLLF